MAEVLQCDRDAAADILDEIASLIQDDGIGQVADLIRDGEYDDHHTVAQVAAHREAERDRAKLNIATAFDCGHKEGVEAERQAVVRLARAYLLGRPPAIDVFMAKLIEGQRGDHRKG